MDKSPDRAIWFPAKRYGWGWGLPIAWQGWVVLLSWMAVFTAGCLYLASSNRPLWLVAWSAAMAAVLIAVAWARGEPLRWRWGGKP